MVTLSEIKEMIDRAELAIKRYPDKISSFQQKFPGRYLRPIHNSICEEKNIPRENIFKSFSNEKFRSDKVYENYTSAWNWFEELLKDTLGVNNLPLEERYTSNWVFTFYHDAWTWLQEDIEICA